MNTNFDKRYIITILVTVLITFVITCIIVAIFAWWRFHKFVDNTIDTFSSIVVDQCKTENIEYRYPLVVPKTNGVYEHKIATSLWDIGGSVGTSNCQEELPMPPPFTRREIIMGKDGAMYGHIYWTTNNRNEIMACMAFTGTYSSSQWNDNLKLQLVPAPELNGSVPDTQIHKGFYEVYSSIRQKLWDWFRTRIELDNASIKHLFITGRSLGGAISTICAYDFADCLNSVQDSMVIHYTFASPRVGNNTFADIFDQRVPNSIRVYNTEDVVPNLPPAIWRGNVYKHVGGSNPIRSNKLFTVNTESIVDNHIEAYRNLPI